jgi:arylsulfatase A-like enzyme
MRHLVFLWSLAMLSPAFAATTNNILLIIADDYGADSSRLYNSPATGASLPPTPNLISLAQQGVVFRNGYAQPVCSPTRATILTGQYAFRTGIGDVVAMGTPALTVAHYTLPEAFAANPSLNYALAQFGKWHLANGMNSPAMFGGWPHFSGSLRGAITSYTSWDKTVNGVQTTGYTNYATTDVVDDARAWILARGAQPWFAWVAFNAPHTPLHKPPTNLAPSYASLPGTTMHINNNPVLYYNAMVEAMDTEIGRLLGAVNLTNTHVIFIGDNGTPNNVLQPPNPAMRGKDTLYEGGVRVPFVIAGPAVTAPGKTNDTPVHTVDLFATILDMAGINMAATVPATNVIDSETLLPFVQGATNLARRAFVQSFNATSPTANDGRMLRRDGYKLIRFDSGTEVFYHLDGDPYEATNLLASALTPVAQSNYYASVLRLAAYQSAIAIPAVTNIVSTASQATLTVPRNTSLHYSLWRASELNDLAWAPVTNAIIVTNGSSSVTLTDTNATAGVYFYRAVATTP